jgi:hypothetical protein
VHAVEVADRHRAATQFTGQIRECAEELHGKSSHTGLDDVQIETEL